MAVTTEHFYSGNDSTTSFPYTFPYYQTSDIKVKVGGTLKTESTHYNVTGTNIVFTSGNVPPDGTNNIHIYRDTDVDTSKATFAAGSSIRSTDLNNNFTQLLYHEQERTFNTIQTGDIATAEGKGQLVNANISDTAAIAGTKISPNFGAQNIVTSGTVDGRDVSTDGTKLDGIEAGATGDQTNAEIRAAVEAATDSNVFTDADHSKLNAIEASATADQTGAQIKSAYEAESDTNAYTDAEKTKLAAIEASADVTDATNVNAAGAVMNSDLDGKGELLVGDGSGDPSALAVGTNGYILTADSSEATGIKWAANAGGGGSSTFAGLSDTPGSLGSAGQHLKVNAAGNALEFTAAPTGTVTETFKTIAVSGQNSVVADGATDTLTLAGGSNVTITTNDSTDTVTIAASGGEVTVQDEGSSLSTAATTLNFVGAGVTASGTGATKTITISGGGGTTSTDFKYLELRNAANDGAASYPASDFTLVTAGTTDALTPAQANALVVSYAGVIQQPNTGTSTPTSGFAISGSTIKFGSSIAAAPDFIIYLQGAGVASIADNTVTGAKIALGSDAAGDIMYYNGTDYVRLAKGSDGQVLKLASGAPSWAAASSGTPEGTAILSTGESGGTKFLREDGDGTCSWQAAGSGTPEGTAILSTGESGTTKFLRVDGDGSCSWQVPPDTNTQVSIDDTPVDGVTNEAISSNWAYDHNAATGNGAHVPAAGSSGQFLKHDGTWGTPPDTNTQLTTEQVEDIVGGMLDGTETGISVTYDDTDGNIDFVVGTLNQDTTGTAAIATTVTVADESSDTTCFPLFATAATGDLGPKSGSNLTFNSNTGALGATSFTGDGSALTNLPASIGDIIEHKNALSADKTIGTNNNALVAGPFSTGSYTLTIPSGSVFTVV